MLLTQTSRLLPNDDFPSAQLFILAICRIAEPIALTSIFPYSWLMVKEFHVGDPTEASFYAGILISAFAFAESLTGVLWGSLSDRIGRKPVLLLGCLGTVLSLLIIGFSRSFPIALLARVLGGALNGNIGVIQTMVAELVKKPEHEPKAYAIMPFVWTIGTIIGPAIGGLLANPSHNYPEIFLKGGLFDVFPWLLPNLVCAILMLISIVASCFFLDETHPELTADSRTSVSEEVAARRLSIAEYEAVRQPFTQVGYDSYGTFCDNDATGQQHGGGIIDEILNTSSRGHKASPQKWFNRQVAMLCVALGLFTYHSMCFDHLLPIFLQDERSGDLSQLDLQTASHLRGGLGMSTQAVGLVMSINGAIALFIQGVIFPLFVGTMGVWRIFILVSVLHPIAYLVMPFTILLPFDWSVPGVYVCLTIRNFCGILAYPAILLLLKQASTSSCSLGKINGLAASVGAASRTIAPPIAGLLYGWGATIGFSGFAWWGAGAVAVAGAIQLYCIPRKNGARASASSET